MNVVQLITFVGRCWMFDNWVLPGSEFLPHVLKHCSGLLSKMEKHPYDPFLSLFFSFIMSLCWSCHVFNCFL